MKSLGKLRELLATVPDGPLTDEDILGTTRKLLAADWDKFKGSQDHAMAAWKLGRMESVEWKPPVLAFTVERHGGPSLGGTRAELQRWHVDFDTMEADAKTVGGRQVEPRARAWHAGTVAEEVAKIVVDRGDHEALRWSGAERRRVRVIMSHFVPGGFKQTVEGRTRRFQEALVRELAAVGWRRVGATGAVFEQPEGQAQDDG